MEMFTYKKEDYVSVTNVLSSYSILTEVMFPSNKKLYGETYNEQKQKVSTYCEEVLGYVPSELVYGTPDWDEVLDIVFREKQRIQTSTLVLRTLLNRCDNVNTLSCISNHVIVSEKLPVSRPSLAKYKSVISLLSSCEERSIVLGIESKDGRILFMAVPEVTGNLMVVLRKVSVVFLAVYRGFEFENHVFSTTYITPQHMQKIPRYSEDEFLSKLHELTSKQ